MGITETVSELNKFIRTILACAVVGGVGYGGGWAYNNLHPQAALKKKDAELQRISNALKSAQSDLQESHARVELLTNDLLNARQKIDRLDTSIRLLKVDTRVAEITVVNQVSNPNSGRAMTEFTFLETDENGKPLDVSRSFVIDGDVVYVDYWVVKFSDQHVEQGTEGLSTSICLFRRIFGEHQEPSDGYTLDQEGSRPAVYGSGELSSFEKDLWENFWTISNDRPRAAKLGIRAMHGEAVSAKLIAGKRYRVHLRASGGLTIRPLREPPPNQI